MDDDWGYSYDLGNPHVGMSEHEVALGYLGFSEKMVPLNPLVHDHFHYYPLVN